MFERAAFLAAVSVGIMASAALVSAQPSTDPSAQAPAETPRARLICRGTTRQLGSHIVVPRRCRTAEQWRIEDEERAQAASNLRLTEGQNDGRAPRAPQ